MNNSTLIQLFKSLDKADRRQLRKVVASPYFNQREDVTALFEYIDKHIDAGAPKLLKEKAFAAIYKKEKFDVDRFYYPMSMLYQIILKFLAINELEKQPPQYNRLLNQSLRQRGAEKIYEKTTSDAKTYLEQQPLRNAHFHLDSFMLRFEEADAEQRLHRDGNFELQEISNDFNYFCIAETLRLSCGLLSHQLVAKIEYKQPLLEHALEVAKEHLDVPAVAMQYYAYKTLSESSKLSHSISTESADKQENQEGIFFVKLKNEIIENKKLFPETELRDLVLVAINYCIRRQNRGELQYVHEALDLFQLGLNEGVLLERGVLSPYTYKNVLMLALKINNYDWAERFLNDYKKFLPEKESENLYKYNYAIYCFRKQDYDKAIELLQEVNLKEVLFNLDARRMLARIYYDLKEFSALDSYIESSKIYLHRQSDIGYHKESYTNFFRTIEKILKSDLRSTTIKDKLRQEVTDTQMIVERDWLLSILK
ncbi:MAG: hypothetical protein U5L45_17040 [Saprospiraceae bacterium]|nr:hypothetical protein [Saprospiraceae bacterium]